MVRQSTGRPSRKSILGRTRTGTTGVTRRFTRLTATVAAGTRASATPAATTAERGPGREECHAQRDHMEHGDHGDGSEVPGGRMTQESRRHRVPQPGR